MSSFAQLVAGCRRGEAEPWTELVERLAGLARHAARRAGVDPPQLDDAVQDVFATLYRHLPGIRDPEALPKWVITTARRQARRHWTRSRLTGDPASAGDDRGSAWPAEQLLEHDEEIRQVREALDKLGGRCASLLTELYRVSGAPDYRTIAARLGIPVGSIGPTRARCLAKLLDLLEGPAISNLGVSRASEEAPVDRNRELGT